MNKARKILNEIKIQENEELAQLFWPILFDFFKKFKAIGATVRESSHAVDLSYPSLTATRSSEYYGKKIISLFSKFFRGSFFQLKQSSIILTNFDIIERNRKQPIMTLSCNQYEKTITIKSYALSTYHGIAAFYSDPDLQAERLEKFSSSHQQVCDILIKAFRLIDPEDLK